MMNVTLPVSVLRVDIPAVGHEIGEVVLLVVVAMLLSHAIDTAR